MAAAEAGPSTAYTTPTKRVQVVSSGEAGPSRRPAGASPAYSSRRHSLYGIEDRIIIDPGSRIWKVGFSGEPQPRAVFWAEQEFGQMWDFDLEKIHGAEGDREEGRRLVGVRVLKKLRETYIDHLMTDTKARKVIILENTYLPTFVKDAIAQALFDNLKVPSISFTPSCVLALAASGCITGLVIDVGWLETSVTPVFASRPLFHLSRSTPLAGKALHARLRALLHHHATYIPPPAELNSRMREKLSPVSLEVLSDKVVEKVLTEGCFAASHSTSAGDLEAQDTEMRDTDAGEETAEIDDPLAMEAFKQKYHSMSRAAEKAFPVSHPGESGNGTGTLLVPGWIRERAIEILFEESKTETESISSAILHCLLKLPIDLRQPLISSLLVTGGTASLPNFIPRLRTTLYRLLTPQKEMTPDEALSRAAWRKRHEEPYRPLYPLRGKLSVMNDPDPLEGEGGSMAGNAGMATRWSPGLVAWVGGSLAGALKISAPETLRETYDTRVADSSARAEAYRRALAQESENEEAAAVEVAAMIGVSVEELRPGMALSGGGEGVRKRGWRDGAGGGVGDWTKAGVGAGVRA